MALRKGKKSAGEDQADIDLTPMLDVVFIMLIFFIVTASFIKESGVDVNRPDQTKNQPADASKSIVVRVTQTDEIWIDQRRVDKRSVRSIIERKYAENPKAGVVVSAANEAKTEAYVSVIDAARAAGVYNVSLVKADE